MKQFNTYHMNKMKNQSIHAAAMLRSGICPCHTMTAISGKPHHKHSLIRGFIFLLAFMLAGAGALHAQKVNWESSTPKMAAGSEPLTVLGDSAMLELYFTITEAAITQAKIEIKLPQYLDYANSVSRADGSDPLTWTFAQTGDPTTAIGRTLTLSITSDGSSLPVDKHVRLLIRLRALCNANTITSPVIQVRILSNTTPVATGGSASATLQGIRLPVLALTSPTPSQTFSAQTDEGNYTLNLTATNAEAVSAKVWLVTDIYTTLDDFKLDGAVIVFDSTITATQKTYTLVLTPAVLGNIKIGSTPRAITFRLKATRCGVRSITSTMQYRYDSNCAASAGVALSASFPAVSGLPNMVHQASYYIDANGDRITGSSPDNINHADINMDGITFTYIKTVFKNEGTADAWDIQVLSNPYSNFTYTDTANIKYQIEDGAEKMLHSSKVTVNSTLGTYMAAIIPQYGYTRPELVGKPIAITFAIDEPVPVGKTLTVWVPTVNGKLYDNGKQNVFFNYHTATINGYRSWVSRVRNRCLDAGPITTVTTTIGYRGVPHFREVPILQAYKSGVTKTQSVRISFAHVYTSLPSDIYVKLPDWLTLTDMYSATSSGSVIAATGSLTYHGNQTWSRRYSTTSNEDCYLYCEFQADACAGSNRMDTIAYWINQNWKGGTLDHIYQVFQPVTFECVNEGVTLQEFGTRRTTKGLKDSNNNSDPDDGSVALDSEILHNTFIAGDQGYFYWKGQIAGSTYSRLYIPVNSTDLSFSQAGETNLRLAGSGTVSINGGGEQTVDYTLLNNKELYLRYQGSLPANAELMVKLPFTVRTTLDASAGVETKFYVSNTDVSSPMSNDADASRFGKDRSATALYTYGNEMLFYWNTDAWTETFTNNDEKNDYYIGYMDNFHGGRFASPYFYKEVRRHPYPYRGTWALPEGYLMSNMRVENNKQLDLAAVESKNLSPAAGSTENVLIYDLDEMYDPQYDGSPGNPLASNKWMLPDDRYNLRFYVDIRATRGAPRGNSIGTLTGVFKHPETGADVIYTRNVTFVYTGVSTQLTVAPATLDAYSQQLTLHTVTVGNPNTSAIQDVYLYVAGNVQNVMFRDKSSGAPVAGIGNGNWFKVSSNMATGTNKDYEITFDYTGGSSCSGDTVRVYSASGFDQPWSPDISQPLNTTDWDHVGARKMVVIRQAQARITGTVSVPTAPTIPLSFNTAFMLVVEVSSAASPGILRNPSVMLSVPPGMQVLPSTARIEYPLGTTPRALNALTPTLNMALGPMSMLTTTRTFNLDFALLNNNGNPMPPPLLMPGNMSGANLGQQTARFMVQFIPQCSTPMTGIRFSGVYTGTSSCGAAAQWNGQVNQTQNIFTDISTNYGFIATVQTVSGNSAFNELRRRDTLVVELRKTVGTSDDMSLTDSLRLTLPASMNIDGVASFAGRGTMAAASTFTPLAVDRGVNAGERYIDLSLPIGGATGYNNAVDKGFGTGNEVIYRIPIIYTPAGQTLASQPLHQIDVNVLTSASFHPSCQAQRASIGGGDLDIALVTARENPVHVPADETHQLEITSTGFTGNWYADATTTTALATNIPTYTPLAMMVCDSTLVYVSAEFVGTNYGRVPLLQVTKIVAVNDTVTSMAGVPVILSVVANDTLPASCSPDIIPNRAPRNGSLTINSDRTFTYTPTPSWYGIDSLDYFIKCKTDSSAARVYMAVIQPGSQKYIACPNARVILSVKTIVDVQYYWYGSETATTTLANGSNVNEYPFTKNSGGTTESVWVEARWKGKAMPRYRIDITAGSNCGGIPTGCLSTGTIVWTEDFDRYGTTENRAPDPGWKAQNKTTYTYQTSKNVGTILPATNHYALLTGRSLGTVSAGHTRWFFTPLDDHTSPNDNSKGYFLNFDATKSDGQFYEFDMTGLCAGTNLLFSAWLMNINPSTWTPSNYVVPIVEFTIEDPSGNLLGVFNTGEIAKQSTATWVNYAFPFTVPAGVTDVKVRFINAQKDANSTHGNDISIDDIEVRLCAPEIQITEPVSDEVNVCEGSSVTFAGTYSDAENIFGSSPQSKWLYSKTGNINNPNEWTAVDGTLNAGSGGGVSNAFTIASVRVDTSGYYRMVVADGINIDRPNCRAMSRVIHLNALKTSIQPDIRVYVKPSAGTIHLSSYIDSLPYAYTINWLPSADFLNDVKGSLDISNWNAPRTGVYKYTVGTADCGTHTAKAYLHVIRQYDKTETIYICKELPLSHQINLNRIFGIEDGGGGSWSYPTDEEGITVGNVSVIPSGRHAGARVFDAVKAYYDAVHADHADYTAPNGNKKFEIKYTNGNVNKTVRLIVY